MPVQNTAPTTDGDLLRLRVDGWCLLEGVIPETQVEDVRESVLRTVATREYIEDRNFLAHNSDFVRHVAEPRILAILEALWGPFHRVGWTGPTSAIPATAASSGTWIGLSAGGRQRASCLRSRTR